MKTSPRSKVTLVLLCYSCMWEQRSKTSSLGLSKAAAMLLTQRSWFDQSSPEITLKLIPGNKLFQLHRSVKQVQYLKSKPFSAAERNILYLCTGTNQRRLKWKCSTFSPPGSVMVRHTTNFKISFIIELEVQLFPANELMDPCTLTRKIVFCRLGSSSERHVWCKPPLMASVCSEASSVVTACTQVGNLSRLNLIRTAPFIFCAKNTRTSVACFTYTCTSSRAIWGLNMQQKKRT